MPNTPRDFIVHLDEVDEALLASRNDIPGDTIEDKLEWLVSDKLRELAEEVVFGG